MSSKQFEVSKLKEALDDSQAKLLSALAKIEVYKSRETILTQEIERLRAAIVKYGENTEGPESTHNCEPNLLSKSQTPKRHTYRVNVIDDDGSKSTCNLIVEEESISLVASKDIAKITRHNLIGLRIDNGELQSQERPSSWGRSTSPEFNRVSLTSNTSSNQNKSKQGMFSFLDKSVWSREPDSAKQNEQGESSNQGTMQLVWKDGGPDGSVKVLNFENNTDMRQKLQQKVSSWTSYFMGDPVSEESGQTQLDTSKQCEANVPKQQPYQQATSSSAQCTAVKLLPSPNAPEIDQTSDILTENEFKLINNSLPARLRFSKWTLLYSTKRDGISLHTLYRDAVLPQTILVIKDTQDHVFGAFVTEQWKPASRFYGTGESFVFQLHPDSVAYKWNRDEDKSNQYFQLANNESLAVGAGQHYAIYIDGDLLYGSSGQCETFNSPCLAHSQEFKASVVELWGIH